jgi:hypothetical protein
VIGITLTANQIRTAPVEVRQWIEREVVAALGLQIQIRHQASEIERIAVCSLEELAAVVSLIQGIIPAVNVLFELGSQGATVADGRLVASRLSDIMHHVRLQGVDQVVSCLDIINGALHRVRGAIEESELCALDSEGHCFVASQTQQNILRLWQEVIRGQQVTSDGVTSGPPRTPRPEFAFANRIETPNAISDTKTALNSSP